MRNIQVIPEELLTADAKGRKCRRSNLASVKGTEFPNRNESSPQLSIRISPMYHKFNRVFYKSWFYYYMIYDRDFYIIFIKVFKN